MQLSYRDFRPRILGIILVLIWCVVTVSIGGQVYSIDRKNRPSTKKFSVLWEQVSKEFFCQDVACIHWYDAETNQVKQKLESVIESLHSRLNDSDIPKPEIVFVTSPTAYSPHVKKLSADTYESSDSPSPFASYLKVEFLPIKFWPHSEKRQNQEELAEVDRFIYMLSHNSRIDDYDDDILSRVRIPFLSTKAKTFLDVHQVVTMMNELFKGHTSFHSHSNRIVYYQPNSASSQFNWQADGVFIERKVNKILYIASELPRIENYQEILIEFLAELYAYYEIDVRRSARSMIDNDNIDIVSDAFGSRLGGGVGQVITGLKQEEVDQIFSSALAFPKKQGLRFTPDLFYLFYFLENITSSLMEQSNFLTISDRDKPLLFSNTLVARELLEEIREMEVWDKFSQKIISVIIRQHWSAQNKERFIEKAFNHPATLLQVIASDYSLVPYDFVAKVELALLNYYYQKTPYQHVIQTLEISVDDLVAKFFQKFFINENSALFLSIVSWLSEPDPKDFNDKMLILSKLFYEAKNSVSEGQILMNQNKAYPYSDIYRKDETIIYYLSLLSLPHNLYLDYLLRNVPATERARCLLSLQFEENLLEYYYFDYFASPIGAYIHTCGRVFNIEKELLRHK
ncbi:MAG: hypothetical protein OXC40_01900 [Proteobacteria bacterium]|nr:hypothetical protein [Pseudomonadota bacterium]